METSLFELEVSHEDSQNLVEELKLLEQSIVQKLEAVGIKSRIRRLDRATTFEDLDYLRQVDDAHCCN